MESLPWLMAVCCFACVAFLDEGGVVLFELCGAGFVFVEAAALWPSIRRVHEHNALGRGGFGADHRPGLHQSSGISRDLRHLRRADPRRGGDAGSERAKILIEVDGVPLENAGVGKTFGDKRIVGDEALCVLA